MPQFSTQVILLTISNFSLSYLILISYTNPLDHNFAYDMNTRIFFLPIYTSIFLAPYIKNFPFLINLFASLSINHIHIGSFLSSLCCSTEMYTKTILSGWLIQQILEVKHLARISQSAYSILSLLPSLVFLDIQCGKACSLIQYNQLILEYLPEILRHNWSDILDWCLISQ